MSLMEEFEEVYTKYKVKVYSVCYRMMGTKEDASDITQDVFVKVYKKLNTFKGNSSLSTWIHRITVNLCLDRLRKKKLIPLYENISAPSPNPWLKSSIERAIQSLPPGYRAVFILHDVEGLTHYEIAETLGIADGSSKSQLHKARKLLRDKLSGVLL